MNQFIDKIKQHWKTILMIIICLMYVGGCTKSCNKSNIIRSKDSYISQQDSIIKSLNMNIDKLNNDIYDLKHQLNIKDVIIDQKSQSVKSLENVNKKITVKIDTVKRN